MKISDIKSGLVYKPAKSATRIIVKIVKINSIHYCIVAHNNRYPKHHDVLYELITRKTIFFDIQNNTSKIINNGKEYKTT